MSMTEMSARQAVLAYTYVSLQGLRIVAIVTACGPVGVRPGRDALQGQRKVRATSGANCRKRT